MTDMESKIIRAAATGFCVDESRVTMDTAVKDLSRDSIRLVAFLSNIDEEFGVYINPRTAMGWKTVREFADYVKGKLADKA